MPTAVDVCNLALSHFGEEKINALDAAAAASSENVAKCLVYYDQARREVLERQNWTFARKRGALTRLTATPAFDWTYQHTLPSDCLRVLEVRAGTLSRSSDGEVVVDDETGSGTATYNTAVDQFEIEAGKVLSHYSLLAIKYIYDAPADGWTRTAAAALARLLAAYLAEAITGDPVRADYHRKIFEDVDLPNAQHHDAVQDQSNENHPLLDRLNNSLLVRARRGGIDGGYTTSGTTETGAAEVDELAVTDDW